MVGPPLNELSISAELAAAAAQVPEMPYLLHPGGSATFRQTYDWVREAALGLIGAGIAPGDRVAVWASNDLPTAIAMLAIPTAGAVVVPLNTRYTAREVDRILARVGCRLILAPDHLHGRNLAREAMEIAGGPPVVCLGDDVPAGAVAWRDICGSASETDSALLDERLGSTTGDEVLLIQFTSGTTGASKGAMLRQGPLLTTARTWASIVGLHAGDIYPILYPLSHVGGFKTGLISPLVARASTILLPVVTTDNILQAFSDHEITVLNGPPAIMRALLDAHDVNAIPTNGLRIVVTGSAIVPPQLVQALSDTFKVDDVLNAYGLTEATGVTCMTRRGDPPELICETLGRPIEGVEVRVTGDGSTGEIQVRGPSVMTGYFDDPAATAAAMDGDWLRTGDVGSIGTDGYIRIAGRADDMINVGGFNVHPAEVEHVLVDHPSVRSAAVVGIDDRRLGTVPVAFVTQKGEPVDPEKLIAWARERLAGFKTPRRIWLVDELPRNASGKVMTSELRARAAGDAP